MASPGMSRSGRVIKKSTKLMDFEEGPSPAKLGRSDSDSPTILHITDLQPESVNIVPASGSHDAVQTTPKMVLVNKPVSSGTPIASTTGNLGVKIKSNLWQKLNQTTPNVQSANVVIASSTPQQIHLNSSIKTLPSRPTMKPFFVQNKPLNIVQQPLIGITPTLIQPTAGIVTNRTSGIVNSRPNMVVLAAPQITSTPVYVPPKPVYVPPKPFITIPRTPIQQSIAVRKRINQEQKRNNLQARVSPSTLSARTPTPKAAPATPDSKKQLQKHSVSAYVLWSCETRHDYQLRYSDLNFISLSRKMGEIWNFLPPKEREIWFKKANLINSTHDQQQGIYHTAANADDLKPKSVKSERMKPITSDRQDVYDDCFRTANNRVGVFGNETHQVGTERIDIHSYLTILGDSLMTMSNVMQRGLKYDSEMDYSLEAGLSTLLDTALVAMGSIATLTASIPQIAPKHRVIETALDEIVYLMPPDDFSNDV